MAEQQKFWRPRGSAGTYKSGRLDLLPADHSWFERARELAARGQGLRRGEWPSPAPLCTYDRVDLFPDAAEVSIELLVVSIRLREFLEGQAPGSAEFHPVRLSGPKASQAPEYFVPIWLNRWECQPDPDLPEIDPSLIPATTAAGVVGGKGWWIGGSPIVRNDLKLKLQKERMIGLRFEEVHLNSPPEAKVRKKNHRTGKIEPVELRMIPADRRFDVEAYFASGRGANDPNDVPDSTAFHRYVQMHSAMGTLDCNVVLRFLQEGGDPNVGAEPHLGPIPVMLGSSTPEVIRALAARGADFAIRDGLSGRTALISAVCSANVPCVRELLSLGVDPNQVDIAGRTALHELAEAALCFGVKTQAFQAMLRLLLAAGGSLEATTAEGSTVLGFAIELWAMSRGALDVDHGEIERERVILALLQAGANPNCRLPRGDTKLIPEYGTPLMCQRYEDGSVHLALLRAGADPLLTCSKGRNAIAYAERCAKKELPDQTGCERALRAMRRAVDRQTD